jgi:hypothetical protein
MSDLKPVEKGKQILQELVSIIRETSDEQVIELFKTGLLDDLIKALLDPSDVSKYPNINEFFLAKKNRATLIAGVRSVITHNYAIKGVTQGNTVFISPTNIQWFDDGVMFLQGPKPFEGFLGLYRQDKTLSYAIAARDSRPGDILGPEYFSFVDETEFRSRLPKTEISKLDEPIQKLETLLNDQINDESRYQELLIEYPWIFGAEYRAIQRHTKLDERNIPDFTGVKVRDGYRDIIEIKPPFTKMFRDNRELNNDFNDAWNQAERYLDFARTDKDYLQRKGLNFDNPKCILILGFNLTDDELRQIRIKERMNAAVHLLTFNDLLAFAKSTASLVRRLKTQESLSIEP